MVFSFCFTHLFDVLFHRTWKILFAMFVPTFPKLSIQRLTQEYICQPCNHRFACAFNQHFVVVWFCSCCFVAWYLISDSFPVLVNIVFICRSLCFDLFILFLSFLVLGQKQILKGMVDCTHFTSKILFPFLLLNLGNLWNFNHINS